MVYLAVTYDCETERTRIINGFLSEYLDWQQNSVFDGSVDDDEFESIRDWIQEFVEDGELVNLYRMDDDQKISIGDVQQPNTDGFDEETMTDDNDKNTNFPVTSLTVDAVREKNQHVDERIAYLESEVERLKSFDETLTSARETLSVDADASVTEAIESLQNDREELRDELNDYRENELDALKQSIVDSSEYDRDDLDGMEQSELQLVADSIDKTVSSNEPNSSIKTPTNDLSDESNSPTTNASGRCGINPIQ